MRLLEAPDRVALGQGAVASIELLVHNDGADDGVCFPTLQAPGVDATFDPPIGFLAAGTAQVFRAMLDGSNTRQRATAARWVLFADGAQCDQRACTLLNFEVTERTDTSPPIDAARKAQILSLAHRTPQHRPTAARSVRSPFRFVAMACGVALIAGGGYTALRHAGPSAVAQAAIPVAVPAVRATHTSSGGTGTQCCHPERRHAVPQSKGRDTRTQCCHPERRHAVPQSKGRDTRSRYAAPAPLAIFPSVEKSLLRLARASRPPGLRRSSDAAGSAYRLRAPRPTSHVAIAPQLPRIVALDAPERVTSGAPVRVRVAARNARSVHVMVKLGPTVLVNRTVSAASAVLSLAAPAAPRGTKLLIVHVWAHNPFGAASSAATVAVIPSPDTKP